MTERDAKSGWLPGLDGLRAFAVVAVMLYHYKTQPYFPGGLFGVDLFFALSGFLITSLLVRQWRSTGMVSLVRFYYRRALRILPAALAFIAVFTVFCFVAGPESVAGRPKPLDATKDAIYAVSYLFSWAVALGKVGGGSAYTPLWSLSVEEQR